MNKIKLTLAEIYQLNYELLGITNQSTGEKITKGILDERLSISVKYHLSKISDKLLKEIEHIEKLKEEHITKVGTKDEDGKIFVSMRINEVKDEEGKLISSDINPAYIQLQETFNKFMEEEFEIEYKEMFVEDINIETDINPVILFKLITTKD
jgi:predicted RNA-binding protein with RPS1 domain